MSDAFRKTTWQKKKKKRKLYDKYIYPKELSKIVLFPQIYEYFFIDNFNRNL